MCASKPRWWIHRCVITGSITTLVSIRYGSAGNPALLSHQLIAAVPYASRWLQAQYPISIGKIREI
jgi:hypothetical protein